MLAAAAIAHRAPRRAALRIAASALRFAGGWRCGARAAAANKNENNVMAWRK
jgi:hypothetical protein